MNRAQADDVASRVDQNNAFADADLGMPDPDNIFDPLHAVPEVEEDLIERPVLPSEYSGDIGFGHGVIHKMINLVQ